MLKAEAHPQGNPQEVEVAVIHAVTGGRKRTANRWAAVVVLDHLSAAGADRRVIGNREGLHSRDGGQLPKNLLLESDGPLAPGITWSGWHDLECQNSIHFHARFETNTLRVP